jgi:hypothetical protein
LFEPLSVGTLSLHQSRDQLHTLLDLRGPIPSFIEITTKFRHEMKQNEANGLQDFSFP